MAVYWVHTPEDEEVAAITGVPLTINPVLTGKATTSLLSQ